MRKPSGFIIYRGPSQLDNKPIVVVAVTASRNRKTGNMVQTYILVDNGKMPVENYKSLADESICGECIHRRGLNGACYVNVAQGPTQVMKGIMKGIYPEDLVMASLQCENRKVRLGTYGDPAAVPSYVWELLLEKASGNTGYTHQWKSGKADSVQKWCMASVDNQRERNEANKKGWRTFRVRTKDEPVLKGEFICPASNEGSKKVHCNQCLACDGGFNANKGSAVIIAHGIIKKRFELMSSATLLAA